MYVVLQLVEKCSDLTELCDRKDKAPSQMVLKFREDAIHCVEKALKDKDAIIVRSYVKALAFFFVNLNHMFSLLYYSSLLNSYCFLM